MTFVKYLEENISTIFIDKAAALNCAAALGEKWL